MGNKPVYKDTVAPLGNMHHIPAQQLSLLEKCPIAVEDRYWPAGWVYFCLSFASLLKGLRRYHVGSPAFYPHSTRLGSLLTCSGLPQAVLLVSTQNRNKGQQSDSLTNLGSLSATSLFLDPNEQQTSPDTRSGQQIAATIPCRSEYPETIIHPFHFVGILGSSAGPEGSCSHSFDEAEHVLTVTDTGPIPQWWVWRWIRNLPPPARSHQLPAFPMAAATLHCPCDRGPRFPSSLALCGSDFPADFPQRSSQSPLHFPCCCTPFFSLPATQGLDWSSFCRSHPAALQHWAGAGPLGAMWLWRPRPHHVQAALHTPKQRSRPTATRTAARPTGPWLQRYLSVCPWWGHQTLSLCWQLPGAAAHTESCRPSSGRYPALLTPELPQSKWLLWCAPPSRPSRPPAERCPEERKESTRYSLWTGVGTDITHYHSCSVLRIHPVYLF